MKVFYLLIFVVNYEFICGLYYEETVVTYVGAVMEYEPYSVWREEEKGYGVIRKNVEAVSSAASIAKLQQADILVAPEGGISGSMENPGNLTWLLTYSTYVPNPWDSIVPCDSLESHPNIEGLKMLSCIAKRESIYLVINLAEAHPCSSETISSAPWSQYDTYWTDDYCPEGGFYVHNTEIVFDRVGTLIARYRKIHLFGESFFTPGAVNDTTAIFVTDFDVPFSLQICFDIGFEDPAYNNVKLKGIKDVISSASWVDYLPFNSADLTQSAWSRGLNINLLISGYHWPEKAKLGSGIYRYLFDEPPVYVYDKDSGNVLLVAEIKTTIESTNKPNVEKRQKLYGKKIEDKIIQLSAEIEERVHFELRESLSDYSDVALESGASGEVFTASVCNVDDFCCNLTYQYTGNLIYKLIALKGQFVVGDKYHIGSQNCAVIWCESDHINTCGLVERVREFTDKFGPFNLSSSRFTIDSIFPSACHRDLTLVSKDILHFSIDEDTYSISADQPIEDLYIAFLFGRWYDNDYIS